MKEKFRDDIPGPDPAFEQTSSSDFPTENLEEISDKISKMMPDMGIIKATGLLKNTDSFKKSKQILDTFKTTMHNLPEGSFTHTDEPPKETEKDSRGPLDKATDNLDMVVNFMTKAGIKVPQIYKDFLYAVRPKTVSNNIDIEKSPPLFVINGLDEQGNVRVETDTDIEIRKGNKKIKLKEEKLRKTLKDSQNVDVQMVKDMRDWVTMNIKKVGSLDKVSEEQWSKLRSMILDKWAVMEDRTDDESVSSNDIEEIIKELEDEGRIMDDPMPTTTKIEMPPSVNKNAYEIRLDILKESIEWVKYQKDNNYTNEITADRIVDTANKLYKFVENKR